MSDLVHNYYISHILYLVVFFFAGCWFAGGGLLIWLYLLINFATASDPLYTAYYYTTIIAMDTFI